MGTRPFWKEAGHRLGVFSKLGNWLTDKSDQFIRGDASDTGRFYASDEARQAYSNMMDVQQEDEQDQRQTGKDAVGFGGSADDPYNGRVPYKSKKQAEMEQQMQSTASFSPVAPSAQNYQQPVQQSPYQAMQATGSFAAVGQQQPFQQQPAGAYTQSFAPVKPVSFSQPYQNYANQPVQQPMAQAAQPMQAQPQPMQKPAAATGYANQQPAAQQQSGGYRQGFQAPNAPYASNVVPFPTIQRGPDGAVYSHVEYVVHLHSRSECANVIEYIKTNASVFLNIEYIANDTERQRCVDMLSGAAYTLGCNLNRISSRGIYLISAPTVCVVMDPTSQRLSSSQQPRGFVQQTYQSEPSYQREPQQASFVDAMGFGTGTQASPERRVAQPQQPPQTQPQPQPQQPQPAYAQPFGGYPQQRQGGQPATMGGMSFKQSSMAGFGVKPQENASYPVSGMSARYASEPAKSAIPRTPAATGFGKRTNPYQQ